MVLASFVFLLVPCLVLSLILRHARACSLARSKMLPGSQDHATCQALTLHVREYHFVLRHPNS